MSTMLTIILSTHNSKKEYFGEAINSILNQTDQNFEVLIVDDASNDECVHMLKEKAQTDDRIKFFHQNENVGVSVNRNLGIEKATGEYVVFLDDDDYLKSDFVEKMSVSAKMSDADIVVCNFEKKIGDELILNPFNAEDGKVYTDSEELEKIAACVIDPKTEGTDIELFMLGSAWGKMYKRQFLLDNSDVRFPEGMMGGEDAVFFIMALLSGASPKVKLIADALYVYRKNEASYTVGYQPKLPEQNMERLKWFYSLSKGKIIMEMATKRNACYAIIDMCSMYLTDKNCPVKNKRKYLKEVLQQMEYKTALDSLNELGYNLPKRVLYLFAKKGFVVPVLLAGKIYRKTK